MVVKYEGNKNPAGGSLVSKWIKTVLAVMGIAAVAIIIAIIAIIIPFVKK